MLRVTSSYASFTDTDKPGSVGRFDADALLATSAALCGGAVSLVAVDMPLAHSSIVGRRVADNSISAAYGSRQASTHTPSAVRPGTISEDVRLGFAAHGYPLLTQAPVQHGLIEVYPHPALIELTGAPQRLPYKEGKVRKYWPDLTMLQRRTRLLEEWAAIAQHLESRVTGVVEALGSIEPTSSRRALKAYEDAIDAVVCAWVGISALNGRAVPFGDDDAATWVPEPRA